MTESELPSYESEIPANSLIGELRGSFIAHVSKTPDDSHADAFVLASELAMRRRVEMYELPARIKCALISARAVDVLPGQEELTSRLAAGGTVKFGIDPTGAEVHLGHAVPIVMADRLRRMGLVVDFVVGDFTAKIGDPSGRSEDRPPLTDADVARNLRDYKDQISPFFVFDKARFHHNNEWLSRLTLSDLLPLLSKIPVSVSMQRDDFRQRLQAGFSLSMAEQLYSIAMAMDSVTLQTGVEIGGVDQLLNLQMCRRVMGESGLTPEVILTTPLLEGTDGDGHKMSKSRGNYVPIAAPASELFGRILSIPDRLTPIYLRALTEILDSEVDAVVRRLHPRVAKELLALELCITVHGPEAARRARDEFLERFSLRKLGPSSIVTVVRLPEEMTLIEALRSSWLEKHSRSHLRRVAEQGGLRIVDSEGAEVARLSAEDLGRSVSEFKEYLSIPSVFMLFGRQAALVELG